MTPTRSTLKDLPPPAPRRARDFVKCTDSECPHNRTWALRIKRFGWTADDYKPHCHPVF